MDKLIILFLFLISSIIVAQSIEIPDEKEKILSGVQEISNGKLATDITLEELKKLEPKRNIDGEPYLVIINKSNPVVFSFSKGTDTLNKNFPNLYISYVFEETRDRILIGKCKEQSFELEFLDGWISKRDAILNRNALSVENILKIKKDEEFNPGTRKFSEIFMKVITKPDRGEKAYENPTEDSDLETKKVKSKLQPLYFYYIYGMQKKGNDWYYLLGNDEQLYTLDTPPQEHLNKMLCGWINAKYVQQWDNRLGCSISKILPYCKIRFDTKKPILIYKTLEDLKAEISPLGRHLDGRKPSIIGKEDIYCNAPWPYNWMRFPVLESVDLGNNLKAYHIAVLSEKFGAMTPERIAKLREEYLRTIEPMRRLDIILVIDTTGSMRESIPAIYKSVKEIAEKLRQLAAGADNVEIHGVKFEKADQLDITIRLAFYKDYVDKNEHISIKEQHNIISETGLKNFASDLKNISWGGGGDILEGNFEILKELLKRQDSFLFYKEDLKDPSILIKKLNNATENKDLLSQYLMSKFSSSLQTKINNYNGTTLIDEKYLELLVQELNNLLKDHNLFEENRFAEILKSEKTKELIISSNKDFSDQNFLEFNRLLLEDAYPHEIVKIQDCKKYFRPGAARIIMLFGDCGNHEKELCKKYNCKDHCNEDCKEIDWDKIWNNNWATELEVKNLLIGKGFSQQQIAEYASTSMYAIHTGMAIYKDHYSYQAFERQMKNLTNLPGENSGAFFSYNNVFSSQKIIDDAFRKVIEQQKKKVIEALQRFSEGQVFQIEEGDDGAISESAKSAIRAAEDRFSELFATNKERDRILYILKGIFYDKGWILSFNPKNSEEKYIEEELLLTFQELTKLQVYYNDIANMIKYYNISQSSEKVTEAFVRTICNYYGIEYQREYIRQPLKEILKSVAQLPNVGGILNYPPSKICSSPQRLIEFKNSLLKASKDLLLIAQNKNPINAEGENYIWDHEFTKQQYLWLNVDYIPDIDFSAKKPFPNDKSVDAPVNLTLTWESEPDTKSMELYFAKSMESFSIAPLATGLTKNQYILTNLIPNTEYKWRIDSTDNDGTVITGKVWKFSTGENK